MKALVICINQVINYENTPKVKLKDRKTVQQSLTSAETWNLPHVVGNSKAFHFFRGVLFSKH